MERWKVMPDGKNHQFKPHRYPNGKYRIELEIDSIEELERLMHSRAIDGHVIIGVRMRSNLGSGPSVIPIEQIDL